jgi:hypothetical protein
VTRAFGVVVLLTLASLGLAQEPVSLSAYEALVRRYAGGDHEATVAELGAWPQGRLESEVAAAMRRRRSIGSCPDCAAALMLHTDCLLAGRRSGHSGRRHQSAALEIAGLMKEVAAQRSFVTCWFAVMAGLAQGQNRWTDALEWAERGAHEVPDAAELQLVLGSIRETIGQEFLRAADDGSALRLDSRGLRAPMIEVQEGRRYLLLARRAFRAALSTNASLSEARLRLGHVAYLLEDASEARARFEDVVHSDRDSPAAFLAHLFLGRLEEDAGRLDEARRAYESALALDPGSQPARLALSHVHLRSGDTAAALRDVETALQAAGHRLRQDPFWLYIWAPSLRAEERLEALRHEASS